MSRKLNPSTSRQIKKVFTGLGTFPMQRLGDNMEEYCHALAARIEANAPRDTGELAGSIKVEVPGEFNPYNGVTVAFWGVVVNSDHAAPIEYGAYGHEGNPFIRKSILEGSKRLNNFVQSGIERGLKQVKG